MAERHGLKQLILLDRLSAWEDEIREQAQADASLKKITQADEAAKVYNWINSPELQPPK